MTQDIETMLARETRIVDTFDADAATKIELELHREMLRANRYGRPVSIIFMELVAKPGAPTSVIEPQRRKIKTLISKQAGDTLRHTDHHGHLASDELLIILPETDLEGAEIAAGKIGRAKIVEAIVAKCARSFDGLFTGVAEMADTDQSVAALITRARENARETAVEAA